MTSLYDAVLKDALRRQEHLQSQQDGTSCYQGENPQGGDRKSASPRKGSDPNKDVFVPWYNQEAFTNKTEGSCVSSLDGDSEPASAHKTRPKNANRKPHGDARAQSLPSSLEHSGSSKGEGTKPTLQDLYAKVKNAHYLRHRVPPESERLLSIREIFGHSDSPQPKEGGEM